jgi:hypothetical protein
LEHLPITPAGLLVVRDAGKAHALHARLASSVALTVVPSAATAVANAIGPWAIAIVDDIEEREVALRSLRAHNPHACLVALAGSAEHVDSVLAQELRVDFLLEPSGTALELIARGLRVAASPGTAQAHPRLSSLSESRRVAPQVSSRTRVGLRSVT